jgi:hypothetical protein
MPEKEGCFHSVKTLEIMNDEQGLLKLLWIPVSDLKRTYAKACCY